MSPDDFIAKCQGITLTERRVDSRASHPALPDAAERMLIEANSLLTNL
jgi:hypothetical protein